MENLEFFLFNNSKERFQSEEIFQYGALSELEVVAEPQSSSSSHRSKTFSFVFEKHPERYLTSLSFLPFLGKINGLQVPIPMPH